MVKIGAELPKLSPNKTDIRFLDHPVSISNDELSSWSSVTDREHNIIMSVRSLCVPTSTPILTLTLTLTLTHYSDVASVCWHFSDSPKMHCRLSRYRLCWRPSHAHDCT